MPEITAAAVTDLRRETGLPLMDCKKALTECGGDKEAAKRWLRERGKQIQGGRADRETGFGRFGLYTSDKVGAIVELKCESAPVAQNDEFVQLASDLAKQLATGPGAETAEQLLKQPSPSKQGVTLGEQKDELFNRIREVFNLGRIVRFDGPCSGYEHAGAQVHGVLLEGTGGSPEDLKGICMHVAAMKPEALSVKELDPKTIETERAILREAALREGKPENIVDKMVEGRLKNFYAERVLLEQEYVRGENKQTVGQFAKQQGIQLKRFVHYILGQ